MICTQIFNAVMFVIRQVWEELQCPSEHRLNKIQRIMYLFKKNLVHGHATLNKLTPSDLRS